MAKCKKINLKGEKKKSINRSAVYIPNMCAHHSSSCCFMPGQFYGVLAAVEEDTVDRCVLFFVFVQILMYKYTYLTVIIQYNIKPKCFFVNKLLLEHQDLNSYIWHTGT